MEPIFSTQSTSPTSSSGSATNIAATPANGSEGGSDAVLTSDFETFLQMLTAQAENQDPLNPVDSTDYATQLATFSGVEQQVLSNNLLQQMATLLGGDALMQHTNWIGMEALAHAPVQFTGSPITLRPDTHEDAQTARLVVRNAQGDRVQSLSIEPGEDTLDWSGYDSEGQPFSQGVYSFEVLNYDENGTLLTASEPAAYSRVTEVRSDGGDVLVRLSDGSELPSSLITALRASG